MPLHVAECVQGLVGKVRRLKGRRAQRSEETGGYGQGRGHVHPCQSKCVGWLGEGEVASCLLHSPMDFLSSLPV